MYVSRCFLTKMHYGMYGRRKSWSVKMKNALKVIGSNLSTVVTSFNMQIQLKSKHFQLKFNQNMVIFHQKSPSQNK
jgi:hypothetical protein